MTKQQLAILQALEGTIRDSKSLNDFLKNLEQEHNINVSDNDTAKSIMDDVKVLEDRGLIKAHEWNYRFGCPLLLQITANGMDIIN